MRRPLARVLALFIALGVSALIGQTLPGLHQPRQIENALRMRPKAVRILVYGRFLPIWFSNIDQGKVPPPSRIEDSPRNLTDIETYDRAGVRVVATVFAWMKPGEALPPEGSAPWRRLQDDFAVFLRRYGPHLTWVTLDNEPTFDRAEADFQPGIGGVPHALRFYGELAARAQAEKKTNASLAKLVVVSPGVYGMDQAARGELEANVAEKMLPLLDWAATNADIEAIDYHAHVKDADAFAAALDFMGKRSGKPVLVCEWSQAPAGTEWLNRPLDGGFRRRYDLPPMTARQFVSRCHSNRVALAQWEDFIALAPYDAGFIARSFALGSAFGVKVMLYPHGQWGNTQFDPCSLLLNRTVPLKEDGTPQASGAFFGPYSAMMAEFEKAARQR
ncbi:MAG: hypothetical protein J0L75_14180 [Spirochaetes bacterium]|nr:hypothetical protein [Spirochaetota bacterium]